MPSESLIYAVVLINGPISIIDLKGESSTMAYRKDLKAAALVSAFAASVSVAATSGTIATKKASTFPETVKDPKPGEIIVKCAGIVKKGKNHCGANGHQCGGLAKQDFDKNEWIYVRKEVCDATAGRVVGKKRVVQ